MKTDKIDKDIQKLRDKISDLQGQLKTKEQQKTDMENSEIVGMVRNLGVKPEDLAAFIQAYQAQQAMASSVVDEPAVEEAAEVPIEQPEEPAATTTEPDTSYSTTYSGGTSYDYSSGSDTERRYSFEDSDD